MKENTAIGFKISRGTICYKKEKASPPFPTPPI